jgi:hypothetical protein
MDEKTTDGSFAGIAVLLIIIALYIIVGVIFFQILKKRGLESDKSLAFRFIAAWPFYLINLKGTTLDAVVDIMNDKRENEKRAAEMTRERRKDLRENEREWRQRQQ